MLQMQVGNDKEDNLQKAEDWISVAAGEGARVVVLPELFTTPFEAASIRQASEPFSGGETVGAIRDAAARHGVLIVGGSFPEQAANGKSWNTSFAVSPTGEILAQYRKMHLFDPAYPGVDFKESDAMVAGDMLGFFDCFGIQAGLAICYDLRFPAFFAKYAREGVRLFFVPAAFNQVSGPAHWELLVRARALDAQSWFVAVSPAPNRELSYNPYGHSLVVDPWGAVLHDAGVGEGIHYATIDPARVETVRGQIPLAVHARPQLYI